MTTKTSESTQAPENGGGSKNLAMEIMGVTKQFGSNVAVNNVSFDVRRGEVLGFLGPNGSGKSTTMRLITSFYTPDSGRILVEGLDNQQYDKETRAMIGYLPENNPLYGDLLVKEYLNYVADLRGLTGAERRENLAMAVDETGIQEVFYKPVSTCSKGYRQRTGLAGAILHQPDILIMDEPTEGLDPNQRVPIRELIRKMGEERTVMLSTHVLPEVEEVCDRLIIIRRGNIVAEGTPDELRNQALSKATLFSKSRGKALRRRLTRWTSSSRMKPIHRQTDEDGTQSRSAPTSISVPSCSSLPRAKTGCCGSCTMRRRAWASCSALSPMKAWNCPSPRPNRMTPSNEI